MNRADNNQVDSNLTAPRHNGLTSFGKLVIQEMNRLGMIVDISHVSKKTMIDVLEITKTPVMFSHSSIYSICDSVRNVQDDILMKLVRLLLLTFELLKSLTLFRKKMEALL